MDEESDKIISEVMCDNTYYVIDLKSLVLLSSTYLSEDDANTVRNSMIDPTRWKVVWRPADYSIDQS